MADEPEDAQTFESGLFKDHMSGQDAAKTLLIQFGSEQCALCPQATHEINEAQKDFEFKWVYHDALTSALAEELNITALPAILFFRSPQDYKAYQKLRGTDVAEKIRAHCDRRFRIDEDF